MGLMRPFPQSKLNTELPSGLICSALIILIMPESLGRCDLFHRELYIVGYRNRLSTDAKGGSGNHLLDLFHGAF